MGTVIEQRSQESWTEALIADFPYSWVSDEAKMSGGVFFAVMSAFAANLVILNEQVVYAWKACRIQTAEDAALDTCAEDYFGDELPREAGETDAAYRIRILASLLLEKVTEQGISNIIFMLTGNRPRMIKPWVAGCTGGYDHAYYDVDTPEIPGCYGDDRLDYQAAIVAKLPNVVIDEACPVWGYDAGAGYDVYTGVYWIRLAANFLTFDQLIAAIINSKAAGITIWLKLDYGTVTWVLANSLSIASGTTETSITVTLLQSPYCVLASGSWISSYYTKSFQPAQYTLGFTTPAPTGNVLNLAAIPFTVPGSGSLPAPAGEFELEITKPEARLGPVLCVTPSWGTTVYITAEDDTNLTMEFGATVPVGGSVSMYWFPTANSLKRSVPAGATAASAAVPEGAIPFATPSWNTECSVRVTGTTLAVIFAVPAPNDDCFVNLGWVVPGS